MKNWKTIRLLFEPQRGLNVNHDAMFRHYVENYLAGFDIEYGGIIAGGIVNKIEGVLEPLYQYLR